MSDRPWRRAHFLPIQLSLTRLYGLLDAIKAGYLVKESRDRSKERARAMRPGAHTVQAFCTVLLVLAVILLTHVPAARAAEANLSRHIDQQLRAGAVSLPLDAEVEYAAALDEIQHGKLDDAKKGLQ